MAHEAALERTSSGRVRAELSRTQRSELAVFREQGLTVTNMRLDFYQADAQDMLRAGMHGILPELQHALVDVICDNRVDESAVRGRRAVMHTMPSIDDAENYDFYGSDVSVTSSSSDEDADSGEYEALRARWGGSISGSGSFLDTGREQTLHAVTRFKGQHDERQILKARRKNAINSAVKAVKNPWGKVWKGAIRGKMLQQVKVKDLTKTLGGGISAIATAAHDRKALEKVRAAESADATAEAQAGDNSNSEMRAAEPVAKKKTATHDADSTGDARPDAPARLGSSDSAVPVQMCDVMVTSVGEALFKGGHRVRIPRPVDVAELSTRLRSALNALPSEPPLKLPQLEVLHRRPSFGQPVLVADLAQTKFATSSPGDDPGVVRLIVRAARGAERHKAEGGCCVIS